MPSLNFREGFGILGRDVEVIFVELMKMSPVFIPDGKFESVLAESDLVHLCDVVEE
jgi:hypothetical protein